MTTPVRTPNRLSKEKSPYLLQHAENPVDWYPWGEEAFSKAREEDKPLFLSIGYSTCHWCHVMARESFMDPEVAALLNRDFVAVKVDREERPDVDHVYMNVCQMLTGSGGWPLTAILTPDKKPFFAGTYFPKRSRFGLPGLYDILELVSSTWSNDRDALLGQADKVYASLTRPRETVTVPDSRDLPDSSPRQSVADRAYRQLSESFDEENGGFGSAPKFPSLHNLMFLLRYWKRRGEKRALDMVEKTVRHAYAGGLFDHVGFGFFRYSTDARWLVPHFEKMLYDQAMWMMILTEVHLATKKDVYRDIAYQVAWFLENEMRSQEGAFWSAVDAESEGEEGKFYVWTPGEVAAALDPKEAQAFCQALGITVEGNFHGQSIPHLARNVGRGEADTGVEPDIAPGGVSDKSRRKIYAARALRVRPGIDDKVLTSWNALAIAAYAKAGRAFSDPALIDTAAECLSFLEKTLMEGDAVYARYRDGEVAYKAYLDDYAFLVWAYLEMHQATLDAKYLDAAQRLAERMVDSFWDEEGGGFFVTGKDAEEMIVRPKEFWDGAIPSGNSVAVMDLLRLSHILGREDLLQTAEAAIDALGPAMRRESGGLSYLISAVLYEEGGAQDVVVHASRRDSSIQAMLSYLNGMFLPDAQVVFAEEKVEQERPYLTICRNRTCSAPISSVDELQKALLTSPKGPRT